MTATAIKLPTNNVRPIRSRVVNGRDVPCSMPGSSVGLCQTTAGTPDTPGVVASAGAHVAPGMRPEHGLTPRNDFA